MPEASSPSEHLGLGTFAAVGVEDVLGPSFLGLGRAIGPQKCADDVLRLSDDSRILSDWDSEGRQVRGEEIRLLLSGQHLASLEPAYRAPLKPAFTRGGGSAGQAFLDHVNETVRETRGGVTQASMYRDFAVSGKFGELDQSSQAVALAAMVSYADTVNGSIIAEHLEGRTADAAVRYATDAAKRSNAIPEEWMFASHSRIGMMAGILMLNMPARHGYKASNASVSGETEATTLGKSYHAQRAAERRAAGDYDMVNQPFVGADGQFIMVPKRVNLRTGQPVAESGTQTSRPDSVVFRREVVIDDKPVGRPMAKDQQEVLRFIRAYELRFGVPPRTIAIERYDPLTMKPVVTELYKPGEFPLRKKLP